LLACLVQRLHPSLSRFSLASFASFAVNKVFDFPA
jgi:hypothetical protein